MRQGLVQVYSGEGKGKTTAASGLALRALAHGQRVLWVRLLKQPAGEVSEVTLLRRLGVTVIEAGIGTVMGAPGEDELTASVAAAMAAGWATVLAGECDLVVFDELNPALARGCYPLAELVAFLEQRPAQVEVVITGRRAPDELLQRADLVTWMENRKHPYAAGIKARPGIEY